MKAQQIKADLKVFARQIDRWCSEISTINDPDSQKWAQRDRRDLMAVHEAVEKCQYKRAFDLACDLDTAVRDQIPNRLYNFLFDYNGNN